MADFKIKIKSKNESFAATENDVEILDPKGNLVRGIFNLSFSATVGEMPTLNLSTYLHDLELDIPRENVFLHKNSP